MSIPLPSDDPAKWMLDKGVAEQFAEANGAVIPDDQKWVTKTEVYDDNCYICRDPEFGLMGLPLCKPCDECTKKEGKPAGHVPADDVECTVCGWDMQAAYEEAQEGK